MEENLTWYQYKYRFYDPALGRFISVDPIAEKFMYNSTYAFAENKLGLGNEWEGLELGPTWHTFHMAAAASGFTDSEYIDKIGDGAFQLIKNTEFTIKGGGGNTVGLGMQLGIFNIGAFDKNGTYALGYNSKDGFINEYSKGSGLIISPLYGKEVESLTIYSLDGRTISFGNNVGLLTLAKIKLKKLVEVCDLKIPKPLHS